MPADTPTRKAAVQALAQALEQYYPEPVLHVLAEEGESPMAIAERIVRQESLERIVRAGDQVHEALIALSRTGPRARGEQARREAILIGLGDVEPGLRRLVAEGLVVMLPAPGQRDWDLFDELETRRYLQREVVLVPAVLEFIRTLLDLTPEAHTIGSSERDVVPDPTPSLDALELNLLHLASRLNGDALILNKDGTPNRRSLSRFVRGLVVPGQTSEDPDLLDPLTFEHIYHIIALGLALELLVVEERAVTTSLDGCRAYFEASEPERDKQLLKAWRNNDRWDAVEASLHAYTGRHLTAASTTDVRRGVLTPYPTAQRLKGPRGQIVSDLKKLPLQGWAEVDQIASMLLALDRGFLESALNSGADAPGYSPQQFVHALLSCALPWLGVAETGLLGADGGSPRRVFHFTPRGRRMLRIDDSSAPSAPSSPSLMVQPNFEITALRANTSLATLHILYRVGERVHLAEHTATFRLTAESVQRGYGQGIDATWLRDFLNAHSRVHVPANVEHDLFDWERRQRKITLYADAVLLEYPDPDRLDLIAGTLEHYRDPSSPPVLRLGSTELLLAAGQDRAIGRAIDLDAAHVIDYEQPPPPCLEHDTSLVFRPLPTGLDIVTRVELDRIAEPIGHPEFPDAWRLDPVRIRTRWGRAAAAELLAFFDARMPDGIPAALELQLLALVQSDIHAEVRRGVTLVVVSTEQVCDILLEVPEVDEHVAARLGPVTLLLDDAGVAAVERTLARLGLLTT